MTQKNADFGRILLRRAGVSLLILIAFCNSGFEVAVAQSPAPLRSSLSARDEAFLEDLSRRLFRYFWEQADPQTGLVADRARTDGSPHDETHRDIASIASTGFGLTALCIAAER